MLSILKYIAGTILIWLRRCSLRRYFRTIEGSTSGARFSKVPKSRSKISNLLTSELFNEHILNVNRGSLHIRRFRCLHLFIFKYRSYKNGCAGPKGFRGFRETGPGSWAVMTGGDKKRGKMHLLQVGDWSKEEREYFSPRTLIGRKIHVSVLIG